MHAPSNRLNRRARDRAISVISGTLPGIALCLSIALAASTVQQALGQAWLDSVVLAVLIGTALRTAYKPTKYWQNGIDFCSKTLLEIAVALLGTSLSAATIFAAGPALLAGIAGVVLLSLGVSFGICQMLRLPTRMAILIACGNSICGNSAIAAVAPMIGAKSDDVAAAIAFTAVLSVVVILCLPLVGVGLELSSVQYGALAGLTVYAVPQVIAAAAPMGSAAINFGVFVKLVRVLMLAPVCLLLSIFMPSLRENTGESICENDGPRKNRLPIHKMVPWFIIAFLTLIAFRSFDLLPNILLAPTHSATKLFLIMSMAALGLGVDVRAVARVGMPIALAVVLSLLSLAALSLGLVRLVGL